MTLTNIIVRKALEMSCRVVLWQLMPHGLSMIGSITVKGQMILMQNPEDTVNLPYDKYYLTKPYSTLPEGVQYNNFGSYHEILLTGRAGVLFEHILRNIANNSE